MESIKSVAPKTNWSGRVMKIAGIFALLFSFLDFGECINIPSLMSQKSINQAPVILDYDDDDEFEAIPASALAEERTDELAAEATIQKHNEQVRKNEEEEKKEEAEAIKRDAMANKQKVPSASFVQFTETTVPSTSEGTNETDPDVPEEEEKDISTVEPRAVAQAYENVQEDDDDDDDDDEMPADYNQEKAKPSSKPSSHVKKEERKNEETGDSSGGGVDIISEQPTTTNKWRDAYRSYLRKREAAIQGVNQEGNDNSEIDENDDVAIAFGDKPKDAASEQKSYGEEGRYIHPSYLALQEPDITDTVPPAAIKHSNGKERFHRLKKAGRIIRNVSALAAQYAKKAALRAVEAIKRKARIGKWKSERAVKEYERNQTRPVHSDSDVLNDD
ncbi:uncharacterized protein BXIN_0040 [Babesia sp. Xinjiang]|uniref:uncharacterized protein n=1 Tax=Babesia sp. Xinjiang TaxID=462227 RepID=UPI000A215726|nr:uncharacterized protein BXIN_0040 [Babesia sp. Xinjiang]ORM39714.1 hypothetical protein BXIN_0040 [Babesia sp. Xinjiang]